MPIPVASTHRSPRRSTIRPATGAEANRTSANTDTTAPAAKLLTPNSLANSGIAGATTPKPRATEKATAVRTATSGGSEAKGFRRARIRPPTLADRDDRRDNRPRHLRAPARGGCSDHDRRVHGPPPPRAPPPA